MGDLKPAADLSDQELIAEWECIDCESVESKSRSDDLAAELKKRGLEG